MNARRFLCSAAVAMAVAATASTADPFAQAPAPGTVPAPAAPGAAGRGRMGGMMAERAKMAAEMTAQARKLDELVAQMHAAKGADKIDKVAAALTELVSQHKAMHSRMMGPGGMMAPESPAPPAARERQAEPPLPQSHDHQTQRQDEELCIPAV